MLLYGAVEDDGLKVVLSVKPVDEVGAVEVDGTLEVDGVSTWITISGVVEPAELVVTVVSVK